MNGKTTVSAAAGLLVGTVLVGHTPMAHAFGDGLAAGAAATMAAAGAVAGQHSGGGPVAAIGTARAAAQAESSRAAKTDAAMATAMDGEAPAADGGKPADSVPIGPVGETLAASTGSATTANSERAAATQRASGTARYDATLHRDPFRPPTLSATVADAGAHTPLERYQIGQLKLVGVVRGAGVSRAMVEDSSGLGYIISAGTPIGSSGGVVQSIEPRRVLIEETITNFLGESEPREVVMELPQEDRSP
jgi:Tfp pilus assembly protein PilP